MCVSSVHGMVLLACVSGGGLRLRRAATPREPPRVSVWACRTHTDTLCITESRPGRAKHGTNEKRFDRCDSG